MLDIDVRTLGDLKSQIGDELAVTDWLDITQERVNQFADATGDHQWIHIDEERARRESPYKTTIAHGFLTLSLVSTLIRSAIHFTGFRHAINYGLNKVRFMGAVPVGSRIRGRIAPVAVEDVKDGVQVTWKVTIERDGSDKPCCVLEWLVRYYAQ